MKAPQFWSDTASWQSRLLTRMMTLLARQYGAIVQYRLRRKPRHHAKIPVICVGNITMGGSGKTPVVQALAALLKQHRKSPAILLRGYGASVRKPFWVMPNMDASMCGDEALLHARVASTLVSPDRAQGARIVEGDSDITHILMDDGLQNPSLYKDISFLVMDGGNPFGNGRIFPAGPLRETDEDALKRVDAVIVLGGDRMHLAQRYQFLKPVFKARLMPVNAQEFTGKPVMAFAGIGRPEKFFDTLRAIHAVPVETKVFPDHYAYTADDVRGLLDRAAKIAVPLVTTRKDWVRLDDMMRRQVQVLDVALQWDDEKTITEFLRQRGMI